jgi:hypothetical protein
MGVSTSVGAVEGSRDLHAVRAAPLVRHISKAGETIEQNYLAEPPASPLVTS